MLNSFNDELIIAGQVEERAAGSGVGQFDERFIHQGVLRKEAHTVNKPVSHLTRNTGQTFKLFDLNCVPHTSFVYLTQNK